MESIELENQAKTLIEVYSNDMNNDLLIELKHFVPRVKLQERGFFQIVRMKMIDSMVLQFVRLKWIIDCQMTVVRCV